MGLIRSIALLSSLAIASTYAASCGGSGVPFRFEVLPSGIPVLGCASPQCFGGGPGGQHVLNDQRFQATADGEDGFYRDGDLTRVRNRYRDAPAQQASCPADFSSTSCVGPYQWVGGFSAQQSGELRLQCCRYDGMKFSAEVGRPIVHPGEVYSGGEVIRDGRQTGFDLISNVRKIDAEDGTVAYELTVTRMNCLPDPMEEENDVELDSSNDITRILDKVAETEPATLPPPPPQQPPPQPPPQQPVQQYQEQIVQPSRFGQNQFLQPAEGEEEIVQVGEQVVPVTSGGYYYPVASGVPACFTGDTELHTPSGTVAMRDLKIGDLVMTVENNATLFTPVESFIHRLPDTVASFIEIATDDGQVLKITPQHFIYKVDCEQPAFNTELVYAENIRQGDCLYKIDDNSSTDNSAEKSIKSIKVRSVTVTRERGAYAPMTTSGDLLVNGIYASCHNVYKASTLSQTYLGFTRGMQNRIRSFFGNDELDGHLPPSAEFFMQMIDVIVPQKY